MFEKIRNYAKNRAFLFVCPESQSDYGYKQITEHSGFAKFLLWLHSILFNKKENVYYHTECSVNNRACCKRRGNTAPFTARLFIGFLPVFGLASLNFPSGSFNGQLFLLEEKPSIGIEISSTSNLAITQDSALVASGAPTFAPQPKKLKVVMTAYSSHRDETDATPFLTASGTKTRDGVVAANFLPFGTAVKIPELFGDKVFVVEDRMHRKFSKRMDVWMPSKKDALLFGKISAEIEIVN